MGATAGLSSSVSPRKLWHCWTSQQWHPTFSAGSDGVAVKRGATAIDRERSMRHKSRKALPWREISLGQVSRHVIIWRAAVIRHRFALLAGVAMLAVTGCCCTGENPACRSPQRSCRLLPRFFSPSTSAADCAAAPWIMLADLENPLSHHADALPSPHRRWFHPVPTKPVFGPGELLLRLETIPDDAVLESPPLLESAPHAQLAPDQPPPLPDEVSDDGG
jgi:hypothetical protein